MEGHEKHQTDGTTCKKKLSTVSFTNKCSVIFSFCEKAEHVYLLVMITVIEEEEVGLLLQLL